MIGDLKVLFLQTAHTKDDDRVGYHQMVSLQQAGHTCAFATSGNDVAELPDVIICDTPKAIWEARKSFGRRTPVIYDITEWYPSKKNLRYTSCWLKPFKFCTLVMANIWAGVAADKFLFGEYYKAKPFRFLFGWKRHLYLPYYPSLRYIAATPPRRLEKEIRLFYAGPQTREKGYNRVQKVVQLCREQMPDRQFVLHAVNERSYADFCNAICQQDFFLDLRDNDPENSRCLPIKLFYYLAAGRPVIYSDLKAIRYGVPEVVQDSLVQPDDMEAIVHKIRELVYDTKRYESICARNRQLAENSYRWEKQQEAFVQFIESCQ